MAEATAGHRPQVAGIILNFALGMPAMAVDTHIHRVCKRMAHHRPQGHRRKGHELLEAAVEPEQVYQFHLAFITHGRQVCKAQRPLCPECVVAESCPSRDQFAVETGPTGDSVGKTANKKSKRAAKLPHSAAVKEKAK